MVHQSNKCAYVDWKSKMAENSEEHSPVTEISHSYGATSSCVRGVTASTQTNADLRVGQISSPFLGGHEIFMSPLLLFIGLLGLAIGLAVLSMVSGEGELVKGDAVFIYLIVLMIVTIISLAKYFLCKQNSLHAHRPRRTITIKLKLLIGVAYACFVLRNILFVLAPLLCVNVHLSLNYATDNVILSEAYYIMKILFGGFVIYFLLVFYDLRIQNTIKMQYALMMVGVTVWAIWLDDFLVDLYHEFGSLGNDLQVGICQADVYIFNTTLLDKNAIECLCLNTSVYILRDNIAKLVHPYNFQCGLFVCKTVSQMLTANYLMNEYAQHDYDQEQTAHSDNQQVIQSHRTGTLNSGVQFNSERGETDTLIPQYHRNNETDTAANVELHSGSINCVIRLFMVHTWPFALSFGVCLLFSQSVDFFPLAKTWYMVLVSLTGWPMLYWCVIYPINQIRALGPQLSGFTLLEMMILLGLLGSCFHCSFRMFENLFSFGNILQQMNVLVGIIQSFLQFKFMYYASRVIITRNNLYRRNRAIQKLVRACTLVLASANLLLWFMGTALRVRNYFITTNFQIVNSLTTPFIPFCRFNSFLLLIKIHKQLRQRHRRNFNGGHTA